MFKPDHLPEAARLILTRLEEAGFEAYIVGGWVRDYLLKIPDQDCDLTTNALPHQIQDLFKDFAQSEVGKDHGTIGLKVLDKWIEVTTYRIDKDIHDNRHPGSVEFTHDLKEDVLRRDFTINALAMNRSGELMDYVGGQEDLKQRVLRCVGDPHLRFEEDALRILRGLRLSSKLDFTIERLTLKAMHSHALLIQSLATERIYHEFSLWIHNPCPSHALSMGKEIVAVFFPEIKTMDESWFTKLDHLHPIILRWMALFYAVELERMMYRLNIWKVSNALKHQLKERLSLVQQRFPKDLYQMKVYLRDHDVKVIQDVLKFQKHFELQQYHHEAQLSLNHLIETQAVYSIAQLDIKGHDLVRLGLKNQAIKEALNQLLERVMKDELLNQHDELVADAKSRLP